MEQQELEFKDYLKIFKRRRKTFFIPALLVAMVGIMLSVLLPSIYSSNATILIEEQEIPVDFVRSTVTSYADQRIQTISQRIMTRSNLSQIIKKYNLYPEERKKDPLEIILEEMRERIKVETISADVIDPRKGVPTQATIAFTLSFDDQSPALAQKVANELTTLFLKENIKTRTQSAENATLFLKEESQRLKEKMKAIQSELAEYKEKNLNSLPEINLLNQQEITALNSRLLNLEAQINSLQERRFYLQGQLAQIDPNALAINAAGNRIFDAKDRLKILESEYPSLLATYSSNHPDVITVKREMDSLKNQIGESTNLNNLNAELIEKKAELAMVIKTYAEEHPSVRSLKQQIEKLQKSLFSAKEKITIDSAIQPDNPAYITLKSQLESVLTEINSVKNVRSKINSTIQKLRKDLRKAPLVEKNYLDIVQELESATLRYREVSARKMEAEISQQLELERKGERFTLIEPPQEPLEPVSPNRTAILFLGLVLAIAAGLGMVMLSETMDPTVHSEKTIVEVLGVMPLVSIPYLESEQEHDALKRKKMIVTISSLFIITVAILVFHFVFMPLDVFWYKLLRVVSVM